MRVAFVVAAVSLALFAAGCGGHHPAAAPLRTCSVALVNPFGHDLAASMPGGTFVVGATYQYSGMLSLVLQRVDSRCHLVRSWARRGTAIFDLPGTYGNFNGSIDLIALGRGGRLLIGGNDGRRELVGQLLPNGRLDRSFGRRGWARIDVHDPIDPTFGSAPLVTSIALAPDGGIYLGGDDQGAHCCAQDFVSKLTATGSVVTGFGDSGTVIVPISGSYTTELAPNPDGSVYAYAEYEQSGTSSPVLIRIQPDGTLDRRFDTAMAHVLRRVTAKDLRFTPTLVPGPASTFVLLGGLDQPGPPLTKTMVSGGAAVAITAAGRVAAEHRFPSPPSLAFDDPPAIRLPSGGIAAAAVLYDNAYRVKSVIVRTFSRDGSAAGVHAIPRASLSGSLTFDGLMPGPRGGVWVAMSSRTHVELIPVP